MRAVTVNAATYVKQDRTSVSITSKKTGWQKINGDYYWTEPLSVSHQRKRDGRK